MGAELSHQADPLDRALRRRRQLRPDVAAGRRGRCRAVSARPVIVDNRPGAGGLVGAEAAANAPADGYTVVMGSFSVLFVSPYLAGKPSLVPQFAPISLLSTVPMILVGKADGRFTDIRAALAEAKAKPGTVSVGHAGNGTTNHIAILRLEVNEGVKFNIIPYKGSGPGLNDLMGGPDRPLHGPAHDLAAAHQVGQAQGPAGDESRPRRAVAGHAVARPTSAASRSTAARRPACWRASRRRSRSSTTLNDARREGAQGSGHCREARRARRRAAPLDDGASSQLT